MKATTSTLAATVAPDKSLVAILCDLVKARLTFLVLLTTLVGFYIGVRGATDYWLMLHTVLGTALVACGAADRPLPSGRMHPETVLVFGGFCSMAGLIYLAFAVNLLTSLIGAVTLASYIFIYTPLKRVTWLNTAVGAIPGALPPVMGWTAARNELTGEGWALFAILFFWQIPHFLAIAWMYREEYAQAGFVMLPSVDPDGFRTGRQAVSHTLGLLTVSLTPYLFLLTGPLYLFGALVLGTVFLGAAVLFSRQLTRPRARQLFFVSILYLPLLLGLMVFDKLKH
jgi:protoheme IX farnesyltransferase